VCCLHLLAISRLLRKCPAQAQHRRWLISVFCCCLTLKEPQLNRVLAWTFTIGVNCYLILRYGKKILSPTPDKGAIGVGDKSKLVGVLEAVIEATRSGELDLAIETAQGPKRVIKRKAA
jgi:hypothetical protein